MEEMINKLRYADITLLLSVSGSDLKWLWVMEKENSVKAGLQLNIKNSVCKIVTQH